jgi:hypothetical protein
MNNSGITNVNVLNTNFLYIQGIRVDFQATNAFLQGEIDAIEQQLVGINNVVSRIDFNQPTPLVGNLVITEENKNSVLLTAIQNINTQIGALNKLDLSALPANPPGACIITPTTTNQALKTLIDNIDVSGLDKFDLTAIPAQPPGAIIITPTTTNQALKGLIDTINGQITTINTKIAHWANFTFGSDSMCGVNDGTGFAVALSGSANGNGIFVYPNNTSVGSQIQIVCANDKDVLIRGGNQLGLYGGKDGQMPPGSQNKVDIGDKNDIISIGHNSDAFNWPTIQIGVDDVVNRDSTTEMAGDIYFSSFNGGAHTAPYTPVLYGDTITPGKFGNTNNYTTDPTFTGLDVVSTNPLAVAPITLSALSGVIAITALAGGVAVSTGVGACAFQCGAGGFSVATGAGILNLATGAGPIQMSTLAGDITIGAGKGAGGSAGNTILNAKQRIDLNPDVETDIYKTAFIEFNENASAPPTTANRLYQQANQLYFDGAPLGGGGGSLYVLKAGDTMTGTLTLPEAVTSILTLNNLTTAPSPVTNRLYLLNNVLTFNGVAVGGGGAFVLKAGDTMTGALNISYTAVANTSQLALTNALGTGAVSTQGSQISLGNGKTGNGTIGDRCGNIVFQGKDNTGAGGRSYASIQSFVNDPTSTATDGRLSSYVTSNGAMTEMLRLVSTSTSVRQINIAGTNTTIGPSAIGSTATDTLRVQGTQSITTSLDVPLIQNAPNIFPATSATLVDGAVRKYQPERFYRLIDYPSPLSAPGSDGEKVVILNNTGAPAGGVDEIIKQSDFPQINGVNMSQIILVKYVDATASTPAMNVIVASYPDNTNSVFIQPDTGGSTLSLTQIGRFTAVSGAVIVNDFVVTTYGLTNRLYFGGTFKNYQVPLPWGPSAVEANNFSGQVVLTWGGASPNFTITNVSVNPMPSYATSSEGIWGNVIGVDADITCVINVKGVSGYPQPNNTFDSIVIGGDFLAVGAPGATQRALKRLAWYDYSNASGTSVTLFSQPTNQNTADQWAGASQLMGTFTPASTGLYTNFSCSVVLGYTGYLDPFSDLTANVRIQLRNSSGAIIAQSASENGVQGIQIGVTQPLTPEVQLVSGQTYSIYVFCSNYSGFSPDDLTYSGIVSPPTPYCEFSAVLITGVIGWKTLDPSYTTPVGPDNKIRGGLLFSSGYLGFSYNGTTITTNSGSLTSNRAFRVYYMSGTASFADFGDPDLIEPLAVQSWLGNYNNVTGGNPTIAFGPGNAVGYAEMYLNAGFNTNLNLTGVSYRPTNVDPYQMTDVLVLTDSGLGANQLLPQFGSQFVSATYRDDTKYPNVYWVARGTELQTATLPFSGAPNYQGVPGPTGQSLPIFTFGGYSDEIGYQGLVLSGSPNVYLYKGSLAGELVIELSGCVVRCANNIYAQNKLTFPATQDGTSIYLVGDTSIVNPYGKPSWWALSQDGGIYYDNVLVNSNGVAQVTAGAGIGVVTSGAVVNVSNTGVTSIVAGNNISITSTGSGGTGAVTINASFTPTPTTTNGYATWGTTGSGNSVVVVNTATNFWGEGQFIFFTPPAYTTGLGNNFLSGNGNRIRWGGTNPISITGQISFMVTLQHFQNGSWFNVVNISQLPGQLPALVGFGARFLVTDQNANPTPHSMGAFDFCINQTNSIDNSTNPGPVGGLVGNMTFTTNMRSGDELYIGFITNSAFNSINAGQYRALFDGNLTNSSSGGISLQISEMPFT